MKKIIISGISLYTVKSIRQVLKTFFGLNYSSLFFLIGSSGLNPNISIQSLFTNHVKFLNNLLRSNFFILKILYKKYVLIIRKEKRLGTYRGLRLQLGLPNRGQRTHSNSRTARKYFFKN